MQFEFCQIIKLRPLNTEHLLTQCQIPKIAQLYITSSIFELVWIGRFQLKVTTHASFGFWTMFEIVDNVVYDSVEWLSTNTRNLSTQSSIISDPHPAGTSSWLNWRKISFRGRLPFPRAASTSLQPWKGFTCTIYFLDMATWFLAVFLHIWAQDLNLLGLLDWCFFCQAMPSCYSSQVTQLIC